MTSSPPSESPHSKPFRASILAVIAIALVALVSTFFLFTSYTEIINHLPRPMQGEAVMIPWSVCLVGYLVLPVLLPWLVSFPWIPQRGWRVYFLLCLLAAVLMWYWRFDFSSLLDKAYRRGL